MESRSLAARLLLVFFALLALVISGSRAKTVRGRFALEAGVSSLSLVMGVVEGP